jgi:hypothetical protein
MALRVEVARTFEDVERLAPLWDAVPWGREEAERASFAARTHARSESLGPFAVFVCDGTRPVGALAGRIDRRELPATVGYKALYSPTVRLLHVVDGGVQLSGEALQPALEAVETALKTGELEAVALPYLPVESSVLTAFEGAAGPLRRQYGSRPQPRRRLVLPASFDEFVASRSANTRWRVRRDARRIEEAFGDELTHDVLRDPSQLERLFAELEHVARTTYQRALGTGFADTPERRAEIAVGLEHGWLRAYVLYLRGEPVAFWLCSVYRGTMLIRTTGYDQQHAELRIGLHLLMKAIDDAIDDPEISVLDFGQGDAAYKQQFSSESSLERNLVVFGPTLRALRVNALRNTVLLSAGAARRVLDASSLTNRVRSGWRGRLRESRR